MAEKTGSSTSLIVSLSFFVLLSIGLTASTYYAFAGRTKRVAELKDASDKAVKAADEAKWEQYQELLLKAYITNEAMTAPERARLAELQAVSDTLGRDQSSRTSLQGLIGALNEGCQWDMKLKEPRQSLMGKIESLEAHVQGLQDALADANDDIAHLKQENEASKSAMQTELDELDRTFQDRSKELADTLSNKSAEYARVQRIVDARDAALEQLGQELDQRKELAARAIEREDRKIQELQIRYDQLNDIVNPKSIVDYARARGTVLTIGRGDMVYINLGSSDHVQPQFRFSVFAPSATGLAEGDRKGAVEVVNVLGPHQSRARILSGSLRDPDLNPITVGDELFNPAWNFTRSEHVAIAGTMDLTGSGHDDTENFMRALKRQGIAIDAFLDLNDMTIRGPGINAQTDYLILGPDPQFDDTVTQRTEANQHKAEVLERMNELKTAARHEGVSIIPINRFLAMTGCLVPKAVTSLHAYEVTKGVQHKLTTLEPDEASVK